MKQLDYVARRQRGLPPERRTEYRGCLRQLPVEDPETRQPYLFLVAFICSSEEQQTVFEARERALAKAEEQLQRVQRGLGSYYRELDQVKSRVAIILSGKAKGLIQVEVGEQRGRPTISWQRDQQAIAAASASDGVYAPSHQLAGAADRRPLTSPLQRTGPGRATPSRSQEQPTRAPHLSP